MGRFSKLKFDTFGEFCERADEILNEFANNIDDREFSYKIYKNYIYNEHRFCESEYRDSLVKDKIWEWLMSCKYEKMNKNDLYSLYYWIGKGN